jgi:hypothetical protein
LECPVRPVQVRAPRLLALQDGELVAQIKISAIFHVSSRRDSRSQEAARVVRKSMNCRHMIDDHHGRTARRATLLVRGMDEILGTHNVRTCRSLPPCPVHPGREVMAIRADIP